MWDADADGYARGEGLAAVVLKPLSAALEDGDHIECIIRGTGINQDGRTAGLTMPSNVAQADLIQATYARAGLDINDPKDRPQFFHAHGTGTPAGDPQESEAISRAFFGNGKVTDTLYVGSIKTIIGCVNSIFFSSCIRRGRAQKGVSAPEMSLESPKTDQRCGLLTRGVAQPYRGYCRPCQFNRYLSSPTAWYHPAKHALQHVEPSHRAILYSS